jgi:hypothetical protein
LGADLQEEIRITDEKVEAKAKETEDFHEKQILEIKRRHEEKLGSLKRENAALSMFVGNQLVAALFLLVTMWQ